MGVMNVLKFSAACFDLILGWPLFAVGYPLCASIWVILTYSMSDIGKLVTYWVLFSLISLFEHAFSNLLEWIPFWPFMKLMVICWLVIPHFDGSYYVYQHLVHPRLPTDPQVVMNSRFNELKKFHSRDGMKELGTWCNICNVSCTCELDMAYHLNGRKHLRRIKQLSKLWCSNCNVMCNSEADMASHRNGSRHLEQLKERLGLWCSICSVSCNGQVDMDSHLNGRRHQDQFKEQLRLWCGACNAICNSEVSMASHLNGRRHLEMKRNI